MSSKYVLNLTTIGSPSSYNTIGQTISLQYQLKNIGCKIIKGNLEIHNSIVACDTYCCVQLFPNETRNFTSSYQITEQDISIPDIFMRVTAIFEGKHIVQSNQALLVLVNSSFGGTGPTGPTGSIGEESIYASAFFAPQTISDPNIIPMTMTNSSDKINFVDNALDFQEGSTGMYEISAYVSYSPTAENSKVSIHIMRVSGSSMYTLYPLGSTGGNPPVTLQIRLGTGDALYFLASGSMVLNPCFGYGFLLGESAGYLSLKRIG